MPLTMALRAGLTDGLDFPNEPPLTHEQRAFRAGSTIGRKIAHVKSRRNP